MFPALDIVRRTGPPESFRDELYTAIVEYLGSHLWHLREMAARTVCSFLIREDWPTALNKLLEDPEASSNRLHGALLCEKFLLKRVAQTSPDKLRG